MPSEHYSEDNDSSVTQYQYSVPMQLDDPKDLTHSSNGSGESPDLLRWRADLLLDEMLLGGADIGSGFHAGNAQPTNGIHSSFANGANHHIVHQQNAAPPTTARPNLSGPNTGYPNTNYPSTTPQDDHSSSMNGYDYETPSNASEKNITETNRAIDRSISFGASRLNAQAVDSHTWQAQSREASANYPANANDTSAAQQPLLVSAEQRYARLAESVPGAQPVKNPQNLPEGMQAKVSTPPDLQGLGPVRRSETAGAMAVGSRGSKYLTLLPRESTSDPETLSREIANLGDQIATGMPAGHESRERAQKLLDKANTILQADPLRSAEVDYYLQQVRAMIERLRQSFGFSALYHQRLRTYLLAWLLLSFVVIIGCILYGVNGVEFASAIAQWSDQSLASQHLIALIITLFAGGLGGSICALWGIRTQLKHESGFLDRKFSLRSMILPITGFVAGLFIYLVLGTIYWGLGWNPSGNYWIAFVPVLLAFFLAFGQEMLLGFRA